MTGTGTSPRIGDMGLRLVSLMMLCLLVGCSDLQDWHSAQRADTLEAYQSFVDGHPDSQYVAVAERRIVELTEDRDRLAFGRVVRGAEGVTHAEAHAVMGGE